MLPKVLFFFITALPFVAASAFAQDSQIESECWIISNIKVIRLMQTTNTSIVKMAFQPS